VVALRVIKGGAEAARAAEVLRAPKPTVPAPNRPEKNASDLRQRVSAGWALVAHSLSGRLLLLTILYVLITEVLILLPTLGRYYTSLLETRIASAEIAILPFTDRVGGQLSDSLRQQLLVRAGAAAVMLTRPDQHDLFLAHDEPNRVDRTIDLRGQNFFTQIGAALDCLFAGKNRTLQVVARTQILHAQTVELITDEQPIRSDLISYGGRVMLVGLGISLATGVLVFLSLYAVFVRPMGRLTRAMVHFHENPEDASRIVTPSDRKDEIGVAERELAAMQRAIFGFLHQKTRLAALGGAVAKIQHDLRNILASAQLASDRLASIEDPVVKRLAPRIVSSLDHAVTLATRTMRFGRADEQPPQRERFVIAPLIDEIGEVTIAGEPSETNLVFDNAAEPALEIDADREQIFRLLLNLVRNAAEAAKEREHGFVEVKASRVGNQVTIRICDNGTGVPVAIREKLFQPFAASTRSAGTGLGLAIARDLARAHGGDVVLESTGETGTCFRIEIPDRRKI
jgi:signal transduction histidine kinase